MTIKFSSVENSLKPDLNKSQLQPQHLLTGSANNYPGVLISDQESFANGFQPNRRVKKSIIKANDNGHCDNAITTRIQ